MYDEAGEIEGSPFTSEMIVAADSTAGMQYFGGSSLAYDLRVMVLMIRQVKILAMHPDRTAAMQRQAMI